MEHPMFITFANQKGGVGKSTLCILFANYLANRKDFRETVAIYDCDPQRSIVKKRQAEEQDAIEKAKAAQLKKSEPDSAVQESKTEDDTSESQDPNTESTDTGENNTDENEAPDSSDTTNAEDTSTGMETTISATVNPENPEETSLMVPYRIEGIDFDDNFFDNLRSVYSTKEVCLFDTPGAALSGHTKGLLQMTDYLICPLHLDRLSISATLEYCSSLLRYREIFKIKTKRNLKFKVIFITNAQDPQVGTKQEKAYFEKAKSMLMKMGTFVSDIKSSADIEQRVSTAGFVKSQKKTVQKTFDEIYDIIFNRSNDE